MKVICKINRLSSIKNANSIKRLKKSIQLDYDLGVKIGQEYIVYGIVFWDNTPWFYLCEEDDDEYPIPFPADLFDITDNSVQCEWMLHFKCIDGEPHTELVFPEWINNPMFYEKLIDGYENEVAIFKKLKSSMQ